MKDYHLVLNLSIKLHSKLNKSYCIKLLDKILPKEIDKYYLAYINFYIKQLKRIKYVTSRDISLSTDGILTAYAIGNILKQFPIERERSSIYISGSKSRPNITKYNISDIRNVCNTYYMPSINLEELKDIINGDLPLFMPKMVQNDANIHSFGAIGDNVTEQNTIPIEKPLANPFTIYTEEEIRAYDSFLSYDFRKSYLFYSSLVKILEPYQSSYADTIGSCYVIPDGYGRDADGYPIINSRYIKDVGLKDVITDLKRLATVRAHRLIAQVHYPMIDWSNHEVHHKCHVRNCCNPFHLSPGFNPYHNKYHRYIADAHPLNDLTKTLQVQDTSPPKKTRETIKWYDVINPNKNISYHPDMDINWENMNKYHRDRTLQIIKQTKH